MSPSLCTFKRFKLVYLNPPLHFDGCYTRSLNMKLCVGKTIKVNYLFRNEPCVLTRNFMMSLSYVFLTIEPVFMRDKVNMTV
jgi:hypothetical protein